MFPRCFCAAPSAGYVHSPHSRADDRCQAVASAAVGAAMHRAASRAKGCDCSNVAPQRAGTSAASDRSETIPRHKEVQMINASHIQEHMEIKGSDGQHVGTVDNVEGDRIKLTKSD